MIRVPCLVPSGVSYDIDEGSIVAVIPRAGGGAILARANDKSWTVHTSLTPEEVHALRRRALAQAKHALVWFTGSMTIVSS